MLPNQIFSSVQMFSGMQTKCLDYELGSFFFFFSFPGLYADAGSDWPEAWSRNRNFAQGIRSPTSLAPHSCFFFYCSCVLPQLPFTLHHSKLNSHLETIPPLAVGSMQADQIFPRKIYVNRSEPFLLRVVSRVRPQQTSQESKVRLGSVAGGSGGCRK